MGNIIDEQYEEVSILSELLVVPNEVICVKMRAEHVLQLVVDRLGKSKARDRGVKIFFWC